jgi:hypothetical protein
VTVIVKTVRDCATFVSERCFLHTHSLFLGLFYRLTITVFIVITIMHDHLHHNDATADCILSFCIITSFDTPFLSFLRSFLDPTGIHLARLFDGFHVQWEPIITCSSLILLYFYFKPFSLSPSYFLGHCTLSLLAYPTPVLALAAGARQANARRQTALSVLSKRGRETMHIPTTHTHTSTLLCCHGRFNKTPCDIPEA